MASTKPPRIVQLQDITLDEYDRNLANLLRGILQECGCETRILVKEYTYYEGRVFHKYRGRNHASCQVEHELGYACTISTAYKIVVMKAIMGIRDAQDGAVIRHGIHPHPAQQGERGSVLG
jgi:hypothetical protein